MPWVCSECSTSNEDSNTICFVCGAPKPVKAASSAKKKGGRKKSVPSSKPASKKSSGLFDSRLLKTICGTETAPSKSTTSAKAASSKPWPEHKIAFSADAIHAKGYVRYERAELKGIKGYRFYKADGSSQFIRCETLLLMNMAHRI